MTPDLARGAMLLLIAFAHGPLFIVDVDRGPDWANEALSAFHLAFVHNHARPMFAFLFGYALVQLMNNQRRRGNDWPAIRTILFRRSVWLIVFGVAHYVFLVPIDILGAYGAAGLLTVRLLRASNKVMLWVGFAALVLATGSAMFSVLFPLLQDVSSYSFGSIAAGDRTPIEMALDRIPGLPPSFISGTLLVAPGAIFGIWAARRRILDEPETHRRFLILTSTIFTAISVLGALPAILIDNGTWTDPSTTAIIAVSVLQPLTGYFGGIALTGLVALAAIAIGRATGPITMAIAALGQRSLSLYLFQSIAFMILFWPWIFGLQDGVGLAGATLIAAAVWVVSVIMADMMRRADYRGPAEILLRRLSYGAPR